MGRLSKEWITEQRAICSKVKLDGAFALHAAEKLFLDDMPAALDALEASMKREAEKDAEIERLKNKQAGVTPTPLSSDQMNIANRLRHGLYHCHDVTIGAEEVHIPMNAIEEVPRLAAELAAEKCWADAAVSDIKQLMASCPSDYRPCDWCMDYDSGVCANGETYAGCIVCQPKWRGPCRSNTDEHAENAQEGAK